MIYKGKTVLVTGASGYIGTALADALSQADADLILWVGRSEKGKHHLSGRKNCRLFHGDVATSKSWKEVLGIAKVDVVFHLAAYEHKHGSKHDPAQDLSVNAGSMLHLLETCRQVEIAPNVVFASSSNLVGIPSSSTVDESTPDNPLTLYGVHKLMAEKYLAHYTDEYGMRGVSLRLTNVYGPAPTKDYDLATRATINQIIRKAVSGGPLKLFKNRAAIRDYVYIDDVVKAFLAAGVIEKTPSPVFYLVGSGEGVSIEAAIRQIAQEAGAHIGKPVEIMVDESVSIDRIGMRNLVADCRGLKAATGWASGVSLAEGIRKTIDFFLP